MPRKTPPSTDDKQVSANFRVPQSLLPRLDAYAADMMRQTPGIHLTRSDAARVLMLKGLDEHDSK